MRVGDLDMKRSIELTAAILAAIVVVACAQKPQEQAAPEPVVQAPVEPVAAAEPGLTNRQRLRKAITALERGERPHARAELQALTPTATAAERTVAQGLLEQLDADPKTALGDKNFDYTLRSGDTLSIVAERYLGDPLKFYILARYNGIENPSRVHVGQSIKVPGGPRAPTSATAAAAAPSRSTPTAASTPSRAASSPPAATPAAEPSNSQASPGQETGVIAAAAAEAAAPSRPPADAPAPEAAPASTPASVSPTPAEIARASATESAAAPVATAVAAAPPARNVNEELRADATRLAATGRYSEAIQRLEPAASDPENRRLLVDLSIDQSDALRERGEYGASQAVLRKAATWDANNPQISQRSRQLETLIAARQNYDRGVALSKQNKPVQAYDSLLKAVNLRPDYPEAKQELDRVRTEAAEFYHREALVQFRRQNLDEAIGIWDKALAIDPNYENARLYKQRAIELKQRIDAVGKSKS